MLDLEKRNDPGDKIMMLFFVEVVLQVPDLLKLLAEHLLLKLDACTTRQLVDDIFVVFRFRLVV